MFIPRWVLNGRSHIAHLHLCMHISTVCVCYVITFDSLRVDVASWLPCIIVRGIISFPSDQVSMHIPDWTVDHDVP